MGLDTVELVMEIEETFDITIPDEEAEKIQTIGDAYRYILARLEGQLRGSPRCLSAATFYRLRRQLMGYLCVERRRIRPDSALADLIPEANRRSEWDRLGKSLGWGLPPLTRPGWVGRAFLGLVLAWTVMLLGGWAWPGGYAPEAAAICIVAYLVGAIGIARTLYEHTRALAIVLPAPDIRRLVPMLLSANAAKIRDHNPHGWSPPEVWEMLIAIVACCAVVDPKQLTEETSFVKDLF